ncbi:hypothetical protein [Kushneria marisflavi]|uniref:Uncharacterized protein n=1 Tax=Kushneria marisflavi TaxID=157779 RepID=A0A240UNJ4_9GAMM|nr:hypothetical protein [Kushneria marisflavi]ART63048.1 hypothetical protein B9H00_08285 [Kushneria marisflavi]RKD84706.1 hypothetical protein C8D96_1931 [Kushneria marisflavi]
MEEQLIVAVYDTEANADAAMQDLRDAGIPEEAINRHTRTDHDSATDHEEKEKPSFWQRLFGKHDHSEDTSAYDRSVERGATVIAVRALTSALDHIENILERHDPVDIDEKSVEHSDGEGLTSGMGAGTAPKVASGGLSGHDSTHADPAMPADREAPMPLSGDELVPGRRDGDRSTPSRVRRHSVDSSTREDHPSDELSADEPRPLSDHHSVRDEEVIDRTTDLDGTHRDDPMGPDRR